MNACLVALYLALLACSHAGLPKKKNRYRISANSFRGNYSFLKVLVRKVFKGGKYSREETIVCFHFLYV